MKIGLWIQNATGSEFLISKDSRGYPRLVSFPRKKEFFENENGMLDLPMEEGKRLYQEVTGHSYPIIHATSRQVLWDLIEASLKLLP